MSWHEIGLMEGGMEDLLTCCRTESYVVAFDNKDLDGDVLNSLS
jgi:hypothetical protein